MKVLSTALVLATALTTVPLAGALAGPPPRVEGFQCSQLVRSVGAANVWQAYFRGRKRNLFDQVWYLDAVRCFQNEANCKAWLYWAQSDYRDGGYNIVERCRRGAGH